MKTFFDFDFWRMHESEIFFWENLVKLWWENGISKAISDVQLTHCAAPEALEHSTLERRRRRYRCCRAAATFRTVVGMVLLEVLKKKVCFTAMSAM